MSLRKFHAIILVLGFAFMIYLVWTVGLQNISGKLRFLGWGLLILILAEVLAEFFHAVSWRYCLSDSHRRISLLRLFGMSIAGYAIAYLTPTASLGGDVTRTALLTGDGKGVEAVSSMFISKLSFALAHLLFVVLGCMLIVPRIALPSRLRSALLGGCLLLAFGIIAFLWIQRCGKLGALARWFVKRKVGGNALQGIVTYVNELDDALQLFYRRRPWGLPLAVFWHLIGYLVGIFQVWFFLHLVAGDSQIVPSIKVWFVGLWFDLLTFVVPMSLGVLEGGRIVAFSSVGYEPPVGMAYAVAFRMVQLSVSIFGLVTYVLLVSKKHPARKSPHRRFKQSSAHESA